MCLSSRPLPYARCPLAAHQPETCLSGAMSIEPLRQLRRIRDLLFHNERLLTYSSGSLFFFEFAYLVIEVSDSIDHKRTLVLQTVLVMKHVLISRAHALGCIRIHASRTSTKRTPFPAPHQVRGVAPSQCVACDCVQRPTAAAIDHQPHALSIAIPRSGCVCACVCV
jgi:hypothetical protein